MQYDCYFLAYIQLSNTLGAILGKGNGFFVMLQQVLINTNSCSVLRCLRSYVEYACVSG